MAGGASANNALDQASCRLGLDGTASVAVADPSSEPPLIGIAVPLTRFGEIVYYQSTSHCQCDARECSILWVLLLAHRAAGCDRRPRGAILIAGPPLSAKFRLGEETCDLT
jgi:hypothetical protein